MVIVMVESLLPGFQVFLGNAPSAMTTLGPCKTSVLVLGNPMQVRILL